jgi:poly(hydroxyalkanoate) depolymerase family esterase
MLHGCTQTVADAASGTRLNMLAEVDGFLVVYPEQAPAANRSKCWNWFQPADQQRGEGEPSLIADITRQVMATYHVDAGRVYVAGMSAGGAMAAILGATYPDLFAAVGVHSGLPRGAARDLRSGLAAMRQGAAIVRHSGGPHVARGVPTIVFHGDRDTTVNPRNGEQVLAQALAPSGADRPERTVSEGRVPNGHTYTRSLYRDVRGNVVGEHWLVHGAGHAWSGGSPSGSFTDPRGPDASKEMLRFFREHPRAERASGS